MNMKNSQLHHLFSVPIWSTQLPKVTSQELHLIQNMKYNEYICSNQKSLGRTHNTYVIDTEDGLSNLKHNIKEAVNYYWHNVIKVQDHLSLKTLHSWISNHHLGAFNPWHHHPNALISAIYYIKIPEDSGQLYFRKDPNHCNLFPNVMEMKYHTKTLFNVKEWSITPKDGMLVVFPSHIEHQASESNSHEDRFMLAIDYWPKGKLLNGIPDDEYGDWDQEF